MSDRRPRASGALAVLVLALVDLVLFADVLAPGTTKVPTAWDVEIHGRLFQFAAAELRQGRLPLWNPYLFSGMPALGNPNGMTLYPMSLLAVVLPLPMVITWGTVFHTFLAGVGTYLWASRRGLHPAGCLLAGAMVSLGGPFFARIHAGHLSVLAAIAWTPVLLLAVDELLRRPSAGWIAAGAIVVAMQALGGHPQFLFYSLLAAGLTVVLRLRETERPLRVAGGFLLMVGLGLGLAAVQLVTVIDALAEAARGAALGQGAASAFSMTWSAFLMLLVPDFFGHGRTIEAYWGDWLYWELTPFVGVVGVAVAAYGVLHGDRRKRAFAGVLAGGFLILALGDVTPVFRLLYEYVPPFDRLRASARALFYFGLYAAMLAAVGVDALLRAPRRSRVLPALLICTALSLGLAAGWIRSVVPREPATAARAEIEEMLRMPPDIRDRRIRELAAGSVEREAALRAAAAARDLAVTPDSPEPAPESYRRAWVDAMALDPWLRLRARLVDVGGYGYRRPREWADPATGWKQAHAAVVGLLVAAAVTAVVAVVLLLVPRRPGVAFVLVALGVVEMATFASSLRQTFDLALLCPPSLGAFYRAAFYRAAPDDYRVQDVTNPNCPMALGMSDVWGYDPLVSSRYLDYVDFVHGHADSRGQEDADIPLRGTHRSYGMLRLQYVVTHDARGMRVLMAPRMLPPPLPRLALMHRYAVHAKGRDVLEALDSPAWDPSETVILESEPTPAPAPEAAGGTVTLRERAADRLVIDAEVPSPALLLVTDAYSRGWRARALPGSDQERYDVLPADAVLRAIPLAAGRHHISLEFMPAYLRLGAFLSLASLAGVGLLAMSALRRRRSAGAVPRAEEP